MNIYLIVILIILVGKYILDFWVDLLNVKNASSILPQEFVGYYDAQKYKLSQNYLKEKTNFGQVEDTVFTLVTIIFMLIGGFNFIDHFARKFNFGLIVTGLLFTFILWFTSQIANIPFSAYQTFVIEAKYGFNRTTVKTFVLDILKSWFLTMIIGGIVFSFILWFFMKMAKWAWFWCWAGLTIFQLFLIFLAPVLILPIFNKFIPLEEGELKKEIENYARSQDFKMKGIFKMDASKRSAKSNAFFTGFGKYKRIVLFDTLIEKHTIDGLVSILAHEIGHYKKRHIVKGVLLSILITGLMFFILSFFIDNQELFAAFKMEKNSLYAGLVFFGFLFSPLNMLFLVLGNILSRKHEYEADAYAVFTYKKPEAFITAFKKLTVDNLSNLTPHPLKVFLQYSHPPVLERIQSIRKMRPEEGGKT